MEINSLGVRQRRSYVVFHILYMWNLKRNDTNELMVAVGEGIVREFGKVI